MEIHCIDWRELTDGGHSPARTRALRVGLIADTHGPVAEPLREMLDRCHILVHAGDVLDAHALACRGRNHAVVAVRGNNDRPAGAPNALGLPDVLELALPGGRLVVIHGDRYPAAVRAARWRRFCAYFVCVGNRVAAVGLAGASGRIARMAFSCRRRWVR